MLRPGLGTGELSRLRGKSEEKWICGASGFARQCDEIAGGLAGRARRASQRTAGDITAGSKKQRRVQLSYHCGYRPGGCPSRNTWTNAVNQPASEAELAALRRSLICGAPYGSPKWVESTAKKLGLESTLRKPGRPMKKRT